MSMYDMANMRKLKTLGAKIPGIWTAYLAFDEAARADGAGGGEFSDLRIAIRPAVPGGDGAYQMVVCPGQP